MKKKRTKRTIGEGVIFAVVTGVTMAGFSPLMEQNESFYHTSPPKMENINNESPQPEIEAIRSTISSTERTIIIQTSTDITGTNPIVVSWPF